jgi:hypothetical protein
MLKVLLYLRTHSTDNRMIVVSNSIVIVRAIHHLMMTLMMISEKNRCKSKDKTNDQ